MLFSQFVWCNWAVQRESSFKFCGLHEILTRAFDWNKLQWVTSWKCSVFLARRSCGSLYCDCGTPVSFTAFSMACPSAVVKSNLETERGRKKKKKRWTDQTYLRVETVPVPNSFFSKLIFYLHIKSNERRIQNHNPELSLCFFETKHSVYKKATESLRELCEQQNKALFFLIPHSFQATEGGIQIKHHYQATFEFQCEANEVLKLDWNSFILNIPEMELEQMTCQKSKFIKHKLLCFVKDFPLCCTSLD